MCSFAVSDCMDATLHAGFPRVAVLLGYFSDPILLGSLSQVLSAWRLFVCHLIQVWDLGCSPAIQHVYLGFLQEVSVYLWSATRGTILPEDRSALDVRVQFQLLFEEFHLFGSIHNNVRRNEIQTSMATLPPRSFDSAGVSLVYPTAALCACGEVQIATWSIRQKTTLFHSVIVQWDWRQAKSSLPFFIIGIRYGFSAGLWDLSQNYLLRRIEIVLEFGFVVRGESSGSRLLGTASMLEWLRNLPPPPPLTGEQYRNTQGGFNVPLYFK